MCYGFFAYVSLSVLCGGTTMEFEDRITKIERIPVRVFGLVMLFLALFGLFIYGAFELIRFTSHLWTSW